MIGLDLEIFALGCIVVEARQVPQVHPAAIDAE